MALVTPIVLALAVIGASAQVPISAGDVRASAGEDEWKLVAIEYARSDGVLERRLVRGAPASARVDMSWYFFVVLGYGRVVLIDCGTDALSQAGSLRQRWSIARAETVAEALARIGLAPADVTDVVLTHHHWDHVGALDRFAHARVHAHRREWRRVPARLRASFDAGRVALLDGSAQLWPGFFVREAGRHTSHQLMVELGCADRRVVIAGDAAYLYRNVAEERPVTVAVDRRANVADVARVVEEVGREDVIPGHDPALFERHRSSIDAVAAICW